MPPFLVKASLRIRQFGRFLAMRRLSRSFEFLASALPRLLMPNWNPVASASLLLSTDFANEIADETDVPPANAC
jgi:hypothetical protein